MEIWTHKCSPQQSRQTWQAANLENLGTHPDGCDGFDPYFLLAELWPMRGRDTASRDPASAHPRDLRTAT